MPDACTRQTLAESSSAAELLEPWAGSLELAVLCDAEGQVLAVNRAFARKFGQPVAAWKGSRMTSLLHPDDSEDWTELGARLWRPPYHISREHRWKTAQGWRWLAWEETALRDAEGELLGVRAIGRDVTKHRLSEEHFRKIAQAVEQAPVSIVMTTPGGMAQYVQAGRLRALAVTGSERLPQFPNVPTVAEQGFPDFSIIEWFVVVGPAGIPPEIVRRLNAEINRAMSLPAATERLRALGFQLAASSPEDVRVFIESEIRNLRSVNQTANIKAE